MKVMFETEYVELDGVEEQIMSCCASIRNELRDLLSKRKEESVNNAELGACIGDLSFVWDSFFGK